MLMKMEIKKYHYKNFKTLLRTLAQNLKINDFYLTLQKKTKKN